MDDAHHVLHVLLTGESDGYYADYAVDTTGKLARWLEQGFVYQGEPMDYLGGERRGQPSASLSPLRFVNCLQNHDQVGNRALGDRLTASADPQALRTAQALLLLCPQVPLLFMGEETDTQVPFRFFTDYHGPLADAVREGRRREFARFPAFADPQKRQQIPDPNDVGTFHDSVPEVAGDTDPQRWRWLRDLLAARHAHIVPRCAGARALSADALGPGCVRARWRLADGVVLEILVNLGRAAVQVGADDEVARTRRVLQAPDRVHVFATGLEPAEAIASGVLPPASLLAALLVDGGTRAAVAPERA